MVSEAPAVAPALSLPAWRVAGIWARHLVSLVIPANALCFLATGPHPWYVAILFLWPLMVAHQIDCRTPFVERRQPDDALPDWPFDLLVYVLAALQIAIVGWTVWLFTQQNVFSVDMAILFIVVGGSSGFSIITAHELIHRKRRSEQLLGRLLLCTVLYEHFYTEHLRGHHVRVGTPEDPATARFGEAYNAFFRRTVPAQLRSAWRLESRRLGDPDMGMLDRRQLRNRVLHGLVLEWGAAGTILAVFGVPSFVAFLLQAFMAVRLLEAVNYFEHWGLVRTGRRVRPQDSWDTHSWFTYYGLIGLSRHADHHAWPARPYQQLRVFDEAPLLPIGYVGLVDMVIVQNPAYQEMAADELGRRRLGPFVDEPWPVEPETARARLARAQAAERRPVARWRRALLRRYLRLPGLAQVGIFLAGVLAVTTLGAHWETGGAEMGLAARLGLHAWILGLVALAVTIGKRIRSHWDHESFAFGVGLACMVGLALAGEALRGLV